MVSIEDFGRVYSVYLAHSTNEDVRFFSSSGGFCKSFLVYLLDHRIIEAAIVTRTGSPQAPLIPETIVTNSKEDILTSRTNSVYALTNPLSVADQLNGDIKYAIVGLGCHIRNLTERQRRGNLKNIEIKIGLLCHHVPSIEFTERILEILGVKKENVRQIEYRGNGWPGGFIAYMKDGTKKLISTDDYWSNDLKNGPRYCRFCSEICEDADVVACDPWNLKLEKTDKSGKTLIFCRNNGLDMLVNDAQNAGFIRIYRCDEDTLVRSQGKHILNKKYRK